MLTSKTAAELQPKKLCPPKHLELPRRKCVHAYNMTGCKWIHTVQSAQSIMVLPLLLPPLNLSRHPLCFFQHCRNQNSIGCCNAFQPRP